MDKIASNLKIELGKQFSNELGKVLNTGSENVTDFMQSYDKTIKSVGNTNENIDDESVIKRKFKKSDITKLVGKNKMKLPIGKLYSVDKTNTESISEITTKKDMIEKWSQKYKNSIDCNNPKGFSQKAHCQGKNKKETKEATAAGAAGGFAPPIGDNPQQKGEFKEATSSASSGSYVTPAAWAKSTSKKDWRGKSKTQIPGGQFVQVKKKCKKFPYCNQGDIKALKLTNEDKLNKMISELSKKHNISESLIKKMIYTEFRNKK
jgi:hypothetical protein